MTDEELVARWQKNRDRVALDTLRRNLKPLTQSQVNKYRANMVPQAVIEAEADRILVESANSYDPGRGAGFRTHVFNNLRRLNRFSNARANVASIPEARAQSIGTYQRVFEQLSERKQRPPTTSELADELMWSEDAVRVMQRSVRRDIMGSGVVTPVRLDTSSARESQLIDDIWWELTPDEKRVFEHITGRGGARKLDKGKDIARATGFSQAKVSQLRSAIARKMERHL